MNTKRTLILAVALLSMAVGLSAQTSALDYAYGYGNVQPLVISTGNTATGAQTVTVRVGYAVTPAGVTFSPLATNAAILVGGPTNQETVTPSAVSCTTPRVNNSCTFTATFSNTHGAAERITSATLGVQEAINYTATAGGGVVSVGAPWASAGGTTTMLSSTVNPVSSVAILDQRTLPKYWSTQPSVLTILAVPTTLTGTTVTFAATPVGTWANSAYYYCVAYVDVLGGEGPCSATYNSTPTLNYTATVTSPAASTGAVGWRFYAGASYAAAYLMPISSTNCTLTTLESVIPACAIGSNGTWTAPPLTTTTLRPNAQSTSANVYQTMPQGHTVFKYQPIGGIPAPFQTNYGPFPAFGSTTSGQIDVLGTVNLPTGYLNQIGRTVKVSGKILGTTLNTAVVPTLTVGLGWVGGLTAGATVPVCVMTGAAVGSTATANIQFSCTLTTNATGATGTIMPGGSMVIAPATGAALESVVESAAAAVGSLSLTTQNTLYVNFTSGSGTSAGLQLLDLHVETLQ